jgi:hypothetical protein
MPSCALASRITLHEHRALDGPFRAWLVAGHAVVVACGLASRLRGGENIRHHALILLRYFHLLSLYPHLFPHIAERDWGEGRDIFLC